MKLRASAIVILLAGLLLLVPLLAPGGGHDPLVPSLAGGAPGLARASASTPGPHPLAASVSLGLTTSTPAVDAKGIARFTLYFNNTGNGSAPHVWINVTAPNGLLFSGDTAAGNVTGYPDYGFSGVGLGLKNFQMSFLVAVGTAPGSLLTVSAAMVFSDGTGGQRFQGPVRASVLIGVETKALYLGWSVSPPGVLQPSPPAGGLVSPGIFVLPRGGPAVNFDLVPALARPFRALNATAVLYVQPVSTPTSVDMNLTLVDVNGAATNAVASVEQVNSVTGSGYWTLFYTFPSMNYLFAAGHQIRLQILITLNSGQGAQLATNATGEPSRIVLQTTTYVTVDSLTPASSPPTYLSPKSSLVITANVSDPFGSAEIVDARLNLAGPGGPLVTWLSLLPAAAVDPSSPSAWKRFQYARSPPLANGTYSIEVTAIGRNGVVDIASGSVTVRAPAFSFQKVSSVAQASSGVRFTYSVWYNNTGTGPAGSVWINDTLPGEVSYVSSVPAFSSSSGSTYRWVLTSVGVGSHVIRITVRVRSGTSNVAYIRNWASLNTTDEQGFPWPTQMSHADVVVNGPLISLNVTSVPALRVHSNESVVYTFTLTNTGDAANDIWLNDTLPSDLTFVADTSGSLRGARTRAGNQLRFAFTNMSSGMVAPVSWSFTLTARAGPGLEWVTDLASLVTLNDTSANDVLMPQQGLTVLLTLASPLIEAAEASFGVPAATPIVPLRVYVNFTNGGNEAARIAWINLTLDPSLRFVGSTLPAIVAGATVRLTLTNATPGPDSAQLDVSAVSSVVDTQVLSISGTLVAADGFGNSFGPLNLTPGSVNVALPNVAFTLSPAGTTLEAGGAMRLTITGGNTGSGAASVVWMNVSLPASLAYVSDSFGVRPVILGSHYSWIWSDYGPGTRAYLLNLTATGSALDRSIADLQFSVQALDLGGRPRPPAIFGGRVSYVAPAWFLSITSDRNATLAGGTCNYTVVIRNVGSTAAHTLWLVLDLAPQVRLITHTAPVPATGNPTLNWTFQDVQPGQTLRFSVLVRIVDGTPANTPIAEVLEAHFSNSVGIVLGYVRSAPAQVEVKADLLPLVYILVGGSVIGAGIVFVVYRRYRVRIEDVFLIYRDGILLSHLTETAEGGKDEDLLSGMLTAVQAFVQDAFTFGEHRQLHQLEFGDYHILIERGKTVYLAVVYAGRDSGLIRKKVRAVLGKIEAAYGEVFERWDGDMQEVQGTHGMLREGFAEVDHPWSLVKPRSP